MWEIVTSDVSSLNKSSTRQLVRYWCALVRQLVRYWCATGALLVRTGAQPQEWLWKQPRPGRAVIPSVSPVVPDRFQVPERVGAFTFTRDQFFRLAQLVRAPVAHQLTFLAPHRRPRTGPTKKCVNLLTMRICQDHSYFWGPKLILVRNSNLPCQTQAG
jgi:hypothetical protein